MEPLEARRVLATFAVNSLVDASDATPLGDGIVDVDLDTPGSQITLRAAIEESNALVGEDSIVFDPQAVPGTIVLTLGELSVTDGLRIEGPGATELTVDASGNDATPGIPDGMGSRVMRIDDPLQAGVAVHLSGLTMTGGDVDGSGGAIRNSNTASLRLTRVELRNNAATVAGGGLYSAWTYDAYGPVEIFVTESTITNNSAQDGGGLYLSGSLGPDAGQDVTVQGSVITGNNASGFGGGAAFNFSQADVRLRSTRSQGNAATEEGGGLWIFMGGGTVSAEQVTVTDNQSSNGGGAYVSVRDSDVAWVDAEIADNRGDRGGGLTIDAYQSDVTISRSTVSGNQAVPGNTGGGVDFRARGYSGSFLLSQSTLSGNTGASYGGGLFYSRSGGSGAYGQMRVESSTIVNNELQTIEGGYGGGLAIRTDYYAFVQLDGAVIAGNTDGDVPSDLDARQVFNLDVRYSFLGDNRNTSLSEAPLGMPDANGNLVGSALGGGVLNPQLGPLTDNSGPTRTHHPLAGSPLIDAGDPNFVGPPNVDQRGSPRLADGDGNGMLRLDMGSVEVEPPVTPVVALTLTAFLDGELVSEPGPALPAGDVAELTYVLSNSGTVPLSNVVVRDDAGTADGSDDQVAEFVTGDANRDGLLDPGETWLLRGSLTVDEGTHTRGILATGDFQELLTSATATVGYVGETSSLLIEKRVDGQDASIAPGPAVVAQVPVTFTYLVTNTGSSDFFEVQISDDNGTSESEDDLQPQAVIVDGIVVGDSNTDGLLNPGETWTYAAETLALDGPVTTNVTATAEGTRFVRDGSPELIQITETTRDYADGEFEARILDQRLVAIPNALTEAWVAQFGVDVEVDARLGMVGTFLEDGEFFELDGQRFEVDAGPSFVFDLDGQSPLGLDGQILSITDDQTPANTLAFEFDADGDTRGDTIVVPTGGGYSLSDIEALVDAIIASDFAGTVELSQWDQGRIGFRGDSAMTWTGADPAIGLSGDYGVSVEAVPLLIEADATASEAANVMALAAGNQDLFAGSRAGRVSFPSSLNVDLSNVSGLLQIGGGGDVLPPQQEVLLDASLSAEEVRAAVFSQLEIDLPGAFLLEDRVFAREGLLLGGPGVNQLDSDLVLGRPERATASTVAFYEGTAAAIEFDGLIQGNDADDAPGISAVEGAPLSFEYVLRNDSNLPLHNVEVVDDAGTPLDASDDVRPDGPMGDVDGDQILDPGEVWTYATTLTAAFGAQQHIARFTATDADGNLMVSAEDLSHYAAENPLTISGSVLEAGPIYEAGTMITLVYDLANQGTLDVANPIVTDDGGTPDAQDDVEVPPRRIEDQIVGDLNQDGVLNPGETWEYFRVIVVVEGAQRHNVTATGDVADVPVATAGFVDYTGEVTIVTVSVAGTVFDDQTGDGVSEDDLPLAGVEIRLFQDNGDGQFDAADPLAEAVITDTAGGYLFQDVTQGTYFVVAVTPENTVQTAGGNLGAEFFTYEVNDVSLVGEFAFSRQTRVVGGLWEDRNGNGRQDSNEPPLVGTTVTLLDADGNVVAETQTDNEGNYAFTGLAAGPYTLRQGSPSAWPQTSPVQKFATAQTLPVGQIVGDVLEGDWDGDGFRDLVVIEDTVDPSADEPVSALRWIRFNPLADEFQQHDLTILPAHLRPQQGRLVDWDLDGDLDLVVAAVGDPLAPDWQQGGVVFAENLGSGAFTTQILSAGDGPRAVEVGDFTGDGVVDVAVVTVRDPALYLFAGDGQGGFDTPTAEGAPAETHQLLSADVNLDGRTDLIGLSPAGVTTWLSDAQEGWIGGPNLAANGDLGRPSQVWYEDLNGDERRDLLVAHENTGSVAWYFAPSESSTEGGWPLAGQDNIGAFAAIALTDVNGDNALDLSWAAADTGQVRTRFSVSDTSAPTVDWQSSVLERETRALMFADLRPDGNLDLLATGVGGTLTVSDGARPTIGLDLGDRETVLVGRIGVLPLGPAAASSGTTAVFRQNAALPADVNDDGLVSPLDALLVINGLTTGDYDQHWFADVSGDGVVSPLDPLLVINHLNAGAARPTAVSPGIKQGATSVPELAVFQPTDEEE